MLEMSIASGRGLNGFLTDLVQNLDASGLRAPICTLFSTLACENSTQRKRNEAGSRIIQKDKYATKFSVLAGP